jgi:hypothetical protein
MSLGTHFVAEGVGLFRVFTLTSCARCGKDAEVNAVTVNGPASKLQQLGLKQHPVGLEELSYSEKFEDAVCSDCYLKVEKPLEWLGGGTV